VAAGWTQHGRPVDGASAGAGPGGASAGTGSAGGRSVTSRVAAILMAFRSGSVHSLTELARLTGLPVSTAHRLVGELVSRRLLERTDDGAYRIGLPLRMIGTPFPSPGPPLLERAAEVMQDLARTTGTAVRLGVLDGERVAVAESDGASVRGFTSGTVPAQSTALGRALLAFSPPAVVDRVLGAGMAALAAPGHLSPERLHRTLATTRLTRIAVLGGRNGMAVAVPVFGTGGTVLAALELGVPDLTTGLQRVRGALVVAAGSLSRELATATPPDGDSATG
jgi:DNA-binding IclR family transcriptional regulator